MDNILRVWFCEFFDIRDLWFGISFLELEICDLFGSYDL
jgi:hypothetical protein